MGQPMPSSHFDAALALRLGILPVRLRAQKPPTDPEQPPPGPEEVPPQPGEFPPGPPGEWPEPGPAELPPQPQEVPPPPPPEQRSADVLIVASASPGERSASCPITG
jgi:hypothetical protein